MGRCGYVPLRRFSDTPLRSRWVFHFRRRGDVLMGRRCYALLRHRHDVPIRRGGDVPLRRLGDVPPRLRWVFHLGCTCDVNRMYKVTSLGPRHDVLFPDGNSVLEPLWWKDLVKTTRWSATCLCKLLLWILNLKFVCQMYSFVALTCFSQM